MRSLSPIPLKGLATPHKTLPHGTSFTTRCQRTQATSSSCLISQILTPRHFYLYQRVDNTATTSFVDVFCWQPISPSSIFWGPFLWAPLIAFELAMLFYIPLESLVSYCIIYIWSLSLCTFGCYLVGFAIFRMKRNSGWYSYSHRLWWLPKSINQSFNHYFC